jgi:CRP/FNR family cyclic AMP-dependent transcriptional regulator
MRDGNIDQIRLSEPSLPCRAGCGTCARGEYSVMKRVLYLLGQLSDLDVEWMMAKGRKERVPAGTVMIREGQPIDALYIILDGVLEVAGRSLGTEKPIRLGCGEVVGEVSFVDSRPPTATVTAAVDSTILSVPRGPLKSRLEQDSEFAARFYRAIAIFLAQRFRDTGRRLGYGKDRPIQEDEEYEGELGAEVLDSIHVAGSRFDRVLQRLLAQ